MNYELNFLIDDSNLSEYIEFEKTLPDTKDVDDLIELFWGESKENIPNFEILKDVDFYDILVKSNVFQSRSSARKDQKWGLLKDIPDGWSEYVLGKKKIKVYIMKFCPLTEEHKSDMLNLNGS